MPVSRFDIMAHADPQTLVRLLNYFTQLGMLPTRVEAVVTGRSMTVRIDQPGMDEHQAGIVAEKMRSSVLVETARVRSGRRLLTPLSENIDDLSAQ